MKRIAIALAALAFVLGITVQTPQAEARRGGGILAGIVIGAVVGGLIASSIHRKRSYAYYPRYYGASVYPAYPRCYWRHGYRYCY